MNNKLEITLNKQWMQIKGLKYNFTPLLITFNEVKKLYENLNTYVQMYESACANTKFDSMFVIDNFENGSLYLTIRETEDNDNLVVYNEWGEFFTAFICVVKAYFSKNILC